jgi:hypothetical protein
LTQDGQARWLYKNKKACLIVSGSGFSLSPFTDLLGQAFCRAVHSASRFDLSGTNSLWALIDLSLLEPPGTFWCTLLAHGHYAMPA